MHKFKLNQTVFINPCTVLSSIDKPITTISRFTSSDNNTINNLNLTDAVLRGLSRVDKKVNLIVTDLSSLTLSVDELPTYTYRVSRTDGENFEFWGE